VNVVRNLQATAEDRGRRGSHSQHTVNHLHFVKYGKQ